MKYKVSALRTKLRKAPDGDVIRSLTQDTDLGEGVESEDRKWVEIGFGPALDQKGFVLSSECVDSSGDPRRDVPREAVVQMCVITEMRFNASEVIKPWYVLADFLIARAIIETDVKNVGQKVLDASAVGPMQITKAEWTDFVQNGGDLVSHQTETDRRDPIRQIDAAAFHMAKDMKALSALRTPAGSDDPFVPQLLDVFFAYLTGSPEAALALRDANATSANRDRPVTEFLRGALADQVSTLHSGRSLYFGKQDSPKSLSEAISSVKAALDIALKKAFEDIKVAIPEALPIVSVPDLGGVGAAFTEKAPRIMRKLMDDFGFKDFQAGGILGNIGHECAGFTLFQEQQPQKGRGGWGWVQWTGDRRKAFEAFCMQNGFPPKSDEANYGFLKHEMTSTAEKKVVAPLKAATNLEQAVEVFERVYERAGVVALSRRIAWGQIAMQAFRSPGAVGGGSGGPNASLVQKLRHQIDAGKIIFDSNGLEFELLGLNTGAKITSKLQSLILKLSELAMPKIRISSLIRGGTDSLHVEGRAVDIGNEEIARALLAQVATDVQVAALGIDELIFDGGLIGEDRNKWNYDQGRKHGFDTKTLDGHRNHIHFAVTAG